MKALFAVVLFVLVSAMQAQTLPEAPKPHLDRIEWSLLAADAAARGLDVYSTRRSLDGGNREAVLPGWIADHSPVMALYSGGIVATQYYVARKLFAHGHRRLAYALTAADFTYDAPLAIHNLLLPVQPTTSPTYPPQPPPCPIPIPSFKAR